MRGRGRLIAAAGVIGALASSQCSPPKASPAPAALPVLWGDMKPVVSVKELMEHMIDPIADNIFDAVGTVTLANRTMDKEPKTDEDWEKIRIGAVTIAEGIYLLKVPRPFTPPGDENNSSGPDAPELSPAQIKAKLDADPVLWNAKIEATRNVALEVLEIVRQKDGKALLAAGGDLDEACENCHLEYWYPGQKRLMNELKRRAETGGDKYWRTIK
jgi:hypothetical protein